MEIAEQLTVPATWANVDQLELQKVAVKLATGDQDGHASLDQDLQRPPQVALSRTAVTARPLEYTDPLGLGRVNPRTLRLLRSTSSEQDSQPQSLPLSLTQSAEFNPQELLLSTEAFDPYKFLAHVHVDSSLSQLQNGVQNLRNEVQEQTGELKQLVKENFERFISCKSTIDDVHAKLVEGDSQNSSNGGTSLVLAEYVRKVREEAIGAFDPIINRHIYSLRVRNVVNLLDRFHDLFQIPATVRKFAKEKNLEGVVNSYADGKKLLQEADDSVWDSLLIELESVVREEVESCLKDLNNPFIDVKQASYLVVNLEALKKLGVETLKDVSPLQLYLTSKENEFQNLISASITKFESQQGEAESVSQLSHQTSGLELGTLNFSGGKLVDLNKVQNENMVIASSPVEMVKELVTLLQQWIPQICSVCRDAQDKPSGVQVINKTLQQCWEHVQRATENVLSSDDDILFFGGSKIIVNYLLDFLTFARNYEDDLPDSFIQNILDNSESIMQDCVENYAHRLPHIGTIFGDVDQIDTNNNTNQIIYKQQQLENLENLESALGRILDHVLIIQHNYYEIGLDWTKLQPKVSQGLQDCINDLVVRSRTSQVEDLRQNSYLQLRICDEIERLQQFVFPRLRRQFESCFGDKDYEYLKSQLSELRRNIIVAFSTLQNERVDKCVKKHLFAIESFDFTYSDFKAIKMRTGVILLIELIVQILGLVNQFFKSNVTSLLQQIVKNLTGTLNSNLSGIRNVNSLVWLQLFYDLNLVTQVFQSLFLQYQINFYLAGMDDVLGHIAKSNLLGEKLPNDTVKEHFFVLFDKQMNLDARRLSRFLQ